jgi:Zn-dependent peptidase ImmA (M78 family)
MSGEERIMKQGRLAELRTQEQALKIRMKALKDSIRIKILDFIKPDELEAETVLDLAIQLNAAHIDYTAVVQEIAAITKALGR